MMNVLSNEDLRRIAPAIFADHAIEGVSAKYSFLPTIDIVYFSSLSTATAGNV